MRRSILRSMQLVDLMEEQARADARRAHAALTRGEESGALHGVPVTIKVNIDVGEGRRPMAWLLLQTASPRRILRWCRSGGQRVLFSSAEPIHLPCRSACSPTTSSMGATPGGNIKRITRRHRGRPVAVTPQKKGRAGFQPHRTMVGRSGPVTAEPHRRSPGTQAYAFCRATAGKHVRIRALRGAYAGVGKASDFAPARVDEVGNPRAHACPAHPLKVLRRCAA